MANLRISEVNNSEIFAMSSIGFPNTFCLFWARLGYVHLHIKWLAVSSPRRQPLHIGAECNLILLRWPFSLQWPVNKDRTIHSRIFENPRKYNAVFLDG
jgi:hypothetical protein